MKTWVCNSCSGVANTKAFGLSWCPPCFVKHLDAGHDATIRDVEIFLKGMGGLTA